MMREVVLDTETTGLDARRGDRIIEIGCIELINRIPTEKTFHHYIHPEDRDVHPDAQAIHGISMDFLRDKPRFHEIAPEFVDFIGDAPLVIHNAAFDIGFINAELQRLPRPAIGMERVVDTLALAKRKYPGGPNSLDALCKRYQIDNSKRTFHGALLDSWLLAEVYLELLGERQATLGLAQAATRLQRLGEATASAIRLRPRPLAPRLGEAEIAAHRAFVETLGPEALWIRFDRPGDGEEGSGRSG
jgi:DNA polymerase III subunit epsilon